MPIRMMELALIAGEGIPAWFRLQSARQGQEFTDVGAGMLLYQ